EAMVTLAVPVDVNMNGNSFSPDAIPITMGNTGYILDKAKDGISTVIYSITPGTTPLNLVKVVTNGRSPPFLPSMAAAALKQRIIVYSAPDEGLPHFNRFDPNTGNWSGAGLIAASTSGDDPALTKLPLGAIIGGVVGGLVVIAVAIFFVIRHRRRSSQKSTNGAELAQLSPDPDADKFDADQGYVQYDQGYQHPSSFIPPPPPINQNAEVSYKVYQPSSTNKDDETHIPTTLDSPYASPASYRESMTVVESPETFYAKAQKSSTGGTPLSPQYNPKGQTVGSDARSPQLFASVSP
ncbi:hypothetical protein BGX23_000571, partial [Mortierella sp. AD031]